MSMKLINNHFRKALLIYVFGYCLCLDYYPYYEIKYRIGIYRTRDNLAGDMIRELKF